MLNDSFGQPEIKTIAVCAAQVPFFSGGAEIHVNALIEQLRNRGYEVELINIPYKWYPHSQLLDIMDFWKKLDLTESNGKKIDMVIATKFPSYFIQHPRKVLWLIHQYRQMYDLLDSPYSGFDMNNAKDRQLRDEFVAMDTEALSSYKYRFTNAQNTANRLQKYNGLESRALYHPPRLVGKYQNISYEDYVLSVGRLDKLKRLDALISALPFLNSTIKCKIAGSGPERDSLEKLARKFNVSDRVEFLGYVSDDDLIQLYGRSSAVYFAPQDEDYGYITLEAFLSQKPVITTADAGGPLEFVEHELNGLILQSLHPEELAKSIERLVSDKPLCAKMGQSGFQNVEHITWQPVIDALLEAAY
ncbi:MAG: glycosyltransferase family 4 protein [Halioglobus sp.]|nr:glycosyltransferase family 4 protein [Halioglobus sp.]